MIKFKFWPKGKKKCKLNPIKVKKNKPNIPVSPKDKFRSSSLLILRNNLPYPKVADKNKNIENIKIIIFVI